MTKRPIRLDDCKYLLVSPINHTLTNVADHIEDMNHDAINRSLRNEKMTPHLIGERVREETAANEEGCIAFDDTIIDEDFSHGIELVRCEDSGNAHGLSKRIRKVNCVYVDPLTHDHWIIDDRIYDPDSDGKTKLDHVRDMLTSLVHHRRLPFRRVLMDNWYATRDLMLFIESLEKIYYCPLRANRPVDDSGEKFPYRRVDSLEWDASALARGKIIKIKSFPKHHKVRLFRVEVSTHRMDWVVTNDLTRKSSQATQEACSLRWKIEQFYRETK